MTVRTTTCRVILSLNTGKTGISQALTAALISGVYISPGSYKVYDLTTYTFKVNNTNGLSGGAILRIRFPGEMNLGGAVCKINGVNAVFDKETVNGRDVVEITLLNTAVGQYGLFNGQVVSVENVRNGDSFEMSESFELEIEMAGVVIEGIYQGLSLSMNLANTFGPTPIALTIENDTVY